MEKSKEFVPLKMVSNPFFLYFVCFTLNLSVWNCHSVIKYKIILYEESETEHFIQKIFSIRHKIVMRQLLSCRAKLWVKFWFFYIKLSLWRLGTDQTTIKYTEGNLNNQWRHDSSLGLVGVSFLKTFIVYFYFYIPGWIANFRFRGNLLSVLSPFPSYRKC